MERSESTLHTRRRISWNESEVARASCTGVHVPTGAYLSLWCARDILISSQSFSLSLSLSLSLSPLYTFIYFHPFWLFFFLFIVRFPFISFHLRLSHFSSTFVHLYWWLSRCFLFVLCIHALASSFRAVATRSCFFFFQMPSWMDSSVQFTGRCQIGKDRTRIHRFLVVRFSNFSEKGRKEARIEIFGDPLRYFVYVFLLSLVLSILLICFFLSSCGAILEV